MTGRLGLSKESWLFNRSFITPNPFREGGLSWINSDRLFKCCQEFLSHFLRFFSRFFFPLGSEAFGDELFDFIMLIGLEVFFEFYKILSGEKVEAFDELHQFFSGIVVNVGDVRNFVVRSMGG